MQYHVMLQNNFYPTDLRATGRALWIFFSFATWVNIEHIGDSTYITISFQLAAFKDNYRSLRM